MYDAVKFNETKTLSFHIDTRVKKVVEGKNYHSLIKNERISLLNLEYLAPSEDLYISIGRLWPKDLSLERVDGMNMSVEKKSFGAGLFGGSKPDPYTEEFNGDYTSGGAYIFYKGKELRANLAAVHNGYKGGTDRQYIYGHFSYFPVGKIRFYSTATIDMDQDTNNFELTNSILEFTVRPDFKKSITVGYNRFQAYQLFKSMDYKIDRSRHQSYYLRGSYQLMDIYRLYGKCQLQSLDYDNNQLESENSLIYQIGIRNNKLLGTDVNLDLNALVSDRKNSKHYTYNLELSEYFMENYQLALNWSHSETEYKDLNDTDSINSYGIAGYFNFSKTWVLSINYDQMHTNEYTTETLFSRITRKF